MQEECQCMPQEKPLTFEHEETTDSNRLVLGFLYFKYILTWFDAATLEINYNFGVGIALNVDELNISDMNL